MECVKVYSDRSQRIQSHGRSPTRQRRYMVMVLFITSDYPSDCG
jgi:hypothetical protein